MSTLFLGLGTSERAVKNVDDASASFPRLFVHPRVPFVSLGVQITEGPKEGLSVPSIALIKVSQSASGGVASERPFFRSSLLGKGRSEDPSSFVASADC